MAVVLSPITVDEQGVAWVEGANTKVKEIILDWLAHGSSPAEIHFQYPYLSLSQIHAAFSYYYAHEPEMNAEIERDYLEVQTLRTRSRNPVSREELLRRLGRS